jgi:hypothetical protein
LSAAEIKALSRTNEAFKTSAKLAADYPSQVSERCLFVQPVILGPLKIWFHSLTLSLIKCFDVTLYLWSQSRSTSKLVDYLAPFVEGLNQMQNGELIVVPGGWVGEKGGHAIMYVVERLSANTGAFAFRRQKTEPKPNIEIANRASLCLHSTATDIFLSESKLKF